MDTDLPRDQITGLVLAGGRGSRMGGVDKGLQMLGGQPLVQHALERLRPQVGALAINANRHVETYARFGVPVWPDAQADFQGPLAGMLAGLAACTTEWLVTVPCDTPQFPTDLVRRLHAAAQAAGVRVAMPVTEGAADSAIDEAIEEATDATTGRAHAASAAPDAPRGRRVRSGPQPQPVFCLLHRSLRDAVAAALTGGERKIERLTRSLGQVLVPFADTQAFFNVNTLEELERLRAAPRPADGPPSSA